MPDEQKPEGSEGPLPAKDEAAKPPVKPAAPAAPAAKPVPPKPAAPPPPKPPAVMMATPWDGDLARARWRHPGVGVPEARSGLRLSGGHYGGGLAQAGRAFRSGLRGLQFPAQRAGADQDLHPRRLPAPDRRGRPPDGQLVGTRGVRYVRHRVRRAPGHATDTHARGVGGLPAEKGLFYSSAGPALGSGEPGYRKRTVTPVCRTLHS